MFGLNPKDSKMIKMMYRKPLEFEFGVVNLPVLDSFRHLMAGMSCHVALANVVIDQITIRPDLVLCWGKTGSCLHDLTAVLVDLINHIDIQQQLNASFSC